MWIVFFCIFVHLLIRKFMSQQDHLSKLSSNRKGSGSWTGDLYSYMKVRVGVCTNMQRRWIRFLETLNFKATECRMHSRTLYTVLVTLANSQAQNIMSVAFWVACVRVFVLTSTAAVSIQSYSLTETKEISVFDQKGQNSSCSPSEEINYGCERPTSFTIVYWNGGACDRCDWKRDTVAF